MTTKSAVERFRTAEELLQRGAPLHALTELEPLLAEQPDSKSVLELAGRAYFQSAQMRRAEEAFRRVVELEPTNAWARFALGRAIERQSRHDEAAGHYRVACAMSPRADYRDALDRVSAR